MTATEPPGQLHTYQAEITYTVTYQGTVQAAGIGDACVAAGNLLRSAELTVPGLTITERVVSDLSVHRA